VQIQKKEEKCVSSCGQKKKEEVDKQPPECLSTGSQAFQRETSHWQGGQNISDLSGSGWGLIRTSTKPGPKGVKLIRAAAIKKSYILKEVECVKPSAPKHEKKNIQGLPGGWCRVQKIKVCGASTEEEGTENGESSQLRIAFSPNGEKKKKDLEPGTAKPPMRKLKGELADTPRLKKKGETEKQDA